jgi:hypothetical protein
MVMSFRCDYSASTPDNKVIQSIDQKSPKLEGGLLCPSPMGFVPLNAKTAKALVNTSTALEPLRVSGLVKDGIFVLHQERVAGTDDRRFEPWKMQVFTFSVTHHSLCQRHR